MTGLDADLEALRVAVQEAVITRGKKWKDTTWEQLHFQTKCCSSCACWPAHQRLRSCKVV
jgi:hypothetical protein